MYSNLNGMFVQVISVIIFMATEIPNDSTILAYCKEGTVAGFAEQAHNDVPIFFRYLLSYVLC